MSDINIITLIGETLKHVNQALIDDEVIDFETESGRHFRMYHDQDCCESVRIQNIKGNILDLIGSKILSVDESISSDWPSDVEPQEYNESCTWTTFTIVTGATTVVIRWCGTSNGYYSESVSFVEL